jgi:hypothetical protein
LKPVGHVHEHQAGMHQIEVIFFQRVVGDIMAAQLNVRQLSRLQPSSVEIGRDDPAGLPYPFGKPAGDARAARSDLQTLPAGSHPEGFEMNDGPRVENSGQPGEATLRLRCPVFQEVSVARHRAP